MKILITGCSGYIGSHLTTELAKNGHTIYGVDRLPYQENALESFCLGDLNDPQTLRKTRFDVDCVFHLAAAKGDWGITQNEYYRDNLEATRELIQAGKESGVTKWIFFSTVSVLLENLNSYGNSKIEAEDLFHQLVQANSETSVTIIRPSAVFGPRCPEDTNIYRLIDAIHRNRFIPIGSGRALKSTSYIYNLLAATMFLLQKMKPGVQTYTYIDSPTLSTGELTHQIYTLLNKKPPSWYIPLTIIEPLAYAFDALAYLTKKDLPITAARIKKFNFSTDFDSSPIRDLGFRSPTDYENALKETVDWYLQTKNC